MSDPGQRARFQAASQLAEQALARPAAERGSWITAQCTEDPELLRDALNLLFSALEVDSIDTPPIASRMRNSDVARSAPDRPHRVNGRAIGSFEVQRELGRGGMGTVYLAKQHEPVRRQVAVKVANERLDESAQLRIQLERQALARLSHRNIARILEAGQTEEGYPYFAMEFVDGPPLLSYCDEQQLSIEERLRLFLDVCSAVEHAHQNGILHRDLKPSNLLTTRVGDEVEPKVIDFGIAKALDRPLIDLTLVTSDLILGTPAYVSPESIAISGDAAQRLAPDTRSDIYSLGVLLQEILMGRRPLKEAAGESAITLLRRVVNEEPPTMSVRWRDLDDETRGELAARRGVTSTQLQRRLRGELEWIVKKATAIDRDERYGSVSELAADLNRYLDEEPVVAGPPSTSYRLRKLIARNRTAAAFSLALVLALIVGFVARSIEAARANREAAEARAARDETDEVVEFLTDLIASSDPYEAAGEAPTVREVVEQAAQELRETALLDRPGVRARILNTLAGVTWRLGRPADGLQMAEEAWQLNRETLGEDAPQTLVALHLVGTLASEIGDYPRSEDLLRQGLASRERVYGAQSIEVADVLLNLGAIHEETSRYEEAITFYERALQILEGLSDSQERNQTLAAALNNLGLVRWRIDENDEAEALLRRALDLRRSFQPAGHPEIANTLDNLGRLLVNSGRLGEAHEALEESLEIKRESLGPGHPLIANTLNSLGQLEERRGRWDEAARLFVEVLETWKAGLGEEHPWLAYAWYNLGRVAHATGQLAESERNLSQAEQHHARFGSSPIALAATRMRLAQVRRLLGQSSKELLDQVDVALLETPAPEYSLFSAAERAWLLVPTQPREAERRFLAVLDEELEIDDMDATARALAWLGLSTLREAQSRAEALEAARASREALSGHLHESHYWFRHIAEREASLQ